jgi:electron transport complex protein RnfA
MSFFRGKYEGPNGHGNGNRGGICHGIGYHRNVSLALQCACTFENRILQTLLFILVIAALVQMVELILKKVSQPLYQALGVYLPLITTNCAILGIAVLVIRKNFTLLQSVAYAVGIAVGFGFALLLFAGIRERMELYDIPEAMKGAPIALVTAGLMSLAFMGFAGMIK